VLAPKLEVRDLRLVVALSKAGTTARAAHALHLAQPSVSRALIALEERLGLHLFDRTPRGLVATDQGRRLTERARELLDELVALERGLSATKPEVRVNLVCECYTAYHWLPSTIARLRDNHPELSIRLRLEHTKTALEAIQSGALDAALLTSACKSSDRLVVAPLFEDELLFVVADDHALAKKRTLSRDDLASHTLFTPGPSAGEARWFMTAVFGRARPRLDVSAVPLIEATVDLARAGLGIAIVTEWVLQPHLARGGCVAKRLNTGPLMRPWHLAWRRELGEAGPTLLAALESALRV
jgi:LysR family transcriptional regulator, regulator for metE and metH